MQLTETLEELLQLFDARIISKDHFSFIILVNKALPSSVIPLIHSISSQLPIPLNLTGRVTPIEYSLPPTAEYEFKNESEQALRALLFLATEKERYDKFCKSIDNEIREELGTQEE